MCKCRSRRVKLSNKGRYAMRALFDIAFYNDGKPTQVKDIAERQAIPPRFLEQIFQDLKRAGIVASKRGPQGGYSLARPAAQVHLSDVVRALEGPIQLGEKSRDKLLSVDDARRVTESVLADLSKQIDSCFAAVSLSDLCARADDLGLPRPGARRYVYAI